MTKALINFEFPETQANRLRNRFAELDLSTVSDRQALLERLGDCEVLIPFFECTREMLDAAPGLKWVQAISAGVDYMPLEEIKRRGILLTNGRGIHTIHMAEYAVAAMVGLARNFHLMFRNQMRKKWDRAVPQGEINGSVAGIIGLGAIGKEIAKRASFFGMKVLGVKSRPEPVESVDEVYGEEGMEEVFKKSDYVINLLPYTPQTEKMIDKRFFGLMKESACFINIGRGKTVNEPDLVEALRGGKIRAMVSDVYFEEPLPEGSPLWEMENVVITPHICGVSPKYMERATDIIEHNLEVYLRGEGEMINVVDLERGY